VQLSPLNIKHRFYFIYQLPSQLASFFRTSLQQKKEFIAIVMAQRVVDLFKIIPISKQK